MGWAGPRRAPGPGVVSEAKGVWKLSRRPAGPAVGLGSPTNGVSSPFSARTGTVRDGSRGVTGVRAAGLRPGEHPPGRGSSVAATMGIAAHSASHVDRQRDTAKCLATNLDPGLQKPVDQLLDFGLGRFRKLD